MNIFDRWGNLVFHTTDYDTPWDGSKNNTGELLESDVYVYTISILDFNRRAHSYKGTVTLVR